MATEYFWNNIRKVAEDGTYHFECDLIACSIIGCSKCPNSARNQHLHPPQSLALKATQLLKKHGQPLPQETEADQSLKTLEPQILNTIRSWLHDDITKASAAGNTGAFEKAKWRLAELERMVSDEP